MFLGGFILSALDFRFGWTSVPEIVVIVAAVLLVKRIKNEEEILEAGLKGYTEYKSRVKYRMIPFIW